MKLIGKTAEGDRKRFPLPAMLLFTAAAAALCALLFAWWGDALLAERVQTVTITDMGPSEESLASEVWLKVRQGEEELDPETLLENSVYTDWSSSDGFLLCTVPGGELTLTWDGPEELTFDFYGHPYTGRAAVTYDGQTEEYDLCSEEPAWTSVPAPWLDAPRTYSVPACLIAAALVLAVLALGAAVLWRIGKRRGTSGAKQNGLSLPAMLLFTAAAAALCVQLFVCWGDVLLAERVQTVTITDMGPSEESLASEVWLKVRQGEEELDPETLLENSVYTDWSSSDGFLLCTVPGGELTLTWDGPEELTFDFQCHPYTGRAAVTYDGQTEEYDLCSEAPVQKSVPAPWLDAPRTYSVPACLIAAALVLVFLALGAAVLGRAEKLRWWAPYAVFWLGGILSVAAGELDAAYGVLMLAAMAVMFCRKRLDDAVGMEKYHHGTARIYLIVIAVGVSFLLAGNMFLDGSGVVLTAPLISCYILLTGALAPLAYLLAAAFQYMRKAQTAASCDRRSQCRRAIYPSILFLAVIAALLIQGVGYSEDDLLVEHESTVTITDLGADENGLGSEVWLRVKQGVEELDPEQLLENAEYTDWFARDGYLLCTTAGSELKLTWDKPCALTFIFDCHPYTGRVAITYEGRTEEYDFYADAAQSISMQAPWNGQGEYSMSAVLVLLVRVLLICVAGISCIIGISGARWWLPYAASGLGAAYIAYKAGRMNGTLCILLLAALATMLLSGRLRRSARMQKYYRFWPTAALSVIGIYMSFALCGNGLFMMEPRMKLTAQTLSYFVLFTGAVCPLMYLFIAGFEYLRSRAEKLEPVTDRKKIRRVRLLCFAVLAVITIVISLGFYPANMSPDSVTHWLEGTGRQELHSANIVIYELFVGLLGRIGDTPYSYIVGQILIFAYVVSSILAWLYKKGFHFAWVVSAAAVFALLPNNYMTQSYLSKNPMFANINLWVIYLLVLLLDDPQGTVRKWTWNVQVIIAFAAEYLVRSNTYFAYYGLGIFILYFTVKNYKTLKIRPLIAFTGSLLLIVMIKGPLYSHLGIIDTPYGPTIPLVTPAISAEKQKLDVPEDIEQTLKKMATIDQLTTRYIPYHSDTLGSDGVVNFNEITLSEAFDVYFEMLSIYPDVVIRDRLDHVESVWNVFQAPKSYNERYYLGIFEYFPLELLPSEMQDAPLTSKGYYYKPNQISEVAVDVADAFGLTELTDIFVWRNGVYVIMLALMLVILCVERRAVCIWVAIPTIVTIGTLVLAMGWQLYPYTYFISVSTVSFIACMLAESNQGHKSKRALTQ